VKLSKKLPGITLANDRPLTVTGAYARREGDHPQPATFVVDGAGIVRAAFLPAEAGEWPSVEQVRTALATLK
jgi:peroxiredoxin